MHCCVGTIVSEPGQARRFIQVLAGPRQAGKTALVRQVLADVGMPSHYGSADEPALRDRVWIEQQWEAARALTRSGGRPTPAVLALDEIQKIAGWSETVKRPWDEDTGQRVPLHVVVLGSSPMLVRGGLSDSLTGRFEIIPVTHWSYGEMEAAFGWTIERYVYYGGYPGAAPLIDEPARWKAYVLDSLIETTVSRDVLLVNRVHKPALLRRARGVRRGGASRQRRGRDGGSGVLLGSGGIGLRDFFQAGIEEWF